MVHCPRPGSIPAHPIPTCRPPRLCLFGRRTGRFDRAPCHRRGHDPREGRGRYRRPGSSGRRPTARYRRIAARWPARRRAPHGAESHRRPSRSECGPADRCPRPVSSGRRPTPTYPSGLNCRRSPQRARSGSASSRRSRRGQPLGSGRYPAIASRGRPAFAQRTSRPSVGGSWVRRRRRRRSGHWYCTRPNELAGSAARMTRKAA